MPVVKEWSLPQRLHVDDVLELEIGLKHGCPGVSSVTRTLGVLVVDVTMTVVSPAAAKTILLLLRM